LRAQAGVELHRVTMAAAAVIDSPLGNFGSQHFFQAHCLRAELDPIGRAAGFVTRTLVFDRVGTPESFLTFHRYASSFFRCWIKLHHIRLAGDAKMK
jgi:hypothetical protein